MGEPTKATVESRIARRVQLRSEAEHEQDVLLIADEPRRRSTNSTAPAGMLEPLNVESVVRKLIALLNEEDQPYQERK